MRMRSRSANKNEVQHGAMNVAPSDGRINRLITQWSLANHRSDANNRAEVSHQHTRQRERHMRRFKSRRQAQRFLTVHGVVQNLFRLGRHLLRSSNYRMLRARSFTVWGAV